MAKFRPVDPSAPPARDRQPMQTSDGAAMTGDRSGADSWAMVHGADDFGKSSVSVVSFSCLGELIRFRLAPALPADGATFSGCRDPNNRDRHTPGIIGKSDGHIC